MIKNYYTILNIDSNSSLNTIKKAFRKEIALYHPDKNKSPEASDKFDDLVEAFDILSVKNKREAYDRMLHITLNNKPVIIEKNEKEEQEYQYKEWQKEAKSKSKKYKSSTLEDLLLLDLFFVSGDLFDEIFDGVGDVLGDVFDLF